MKKRSLLIGLFAAFGIFILFFLLAAAGLFVGQGGGVLKLGDKIGIIEITGIIVDSRYINEKLMEYGERDDIKAIIIRIDSPGGGVGPSQEIYREVKQVREKKRVVVSMGSVAASGGYYIAAAGERIFANPGTLTGSIGVVMEFTNVEELLSKIGLRGYVVKSGEYKDIGSPLRKMTDNEKKLLQSVIDNVHEQFIHAVAEGRNIELSRVKDIADGRIFTGAQAKKIGLVDELGSLADAVEATAKMAGIRGKPVVVYPKKRGISLWDILFSEDAVSQILNLFKNSYGLSAVSYR